MFHYPNNSYSVSFDLMSEYTVHIVKFTVLICTDFLKSLRCFPDKLDDIHILDQLKLKTPETQTHGKNDFRWQKNT